MLSAMAALEQKRSELAEIQGQLEAMTFRWDTGAPDLAERRRYAILLASEELLLLELRRARPPLSL